MVNKFIYSCVILSFLILIGCTPTTVNVYKAPESTYESYEVILIPDFRKTDLEWVPYDSGVEIADMVAEELRTKNNIDVVSRSSTYDNVGQQRVLLVRGTVSGYVRGCKYCEYVFRGIKDKGKMSVQVWVTLIDGTTGEILADVGIDGRAKGPGTGRSKYVRVVDEIVNLVEVVNSGQS
ncbi:MAG: hypothetical protein IH964_06455 [Candidatus Dadabacteria bacterium]|nr:hypothetical protein [Candidatus Dadabacteria bacterium]